MKKLFFSFLPVLFLLLGIPQAGAYEAVIKWETPGSVNLILGSVNGQKAELAPDQTSYTVSYESYTSVYIVPTADYTLVSATEKAGASKKPSFNATLGGQFVSISLGSAANGQEWTVNTKAKEYTGSFSLTVSGAQNIGSLQLKDAAGNVTSQLEVADGTKTVRLTSDDKTLECQGSSFGKDFIPFKSVTVNGTTIEQDPAQKFRPCYKTDIAPNDNVVIDANSDNDVQVKIEFADNTPAACLSSVYYNNLIDAAALQAANYTLTVAAGASMRLTFNTEDYDIKSVKLNNADADYTKAITIAEASTITISAAAKTFDPVPVVLYTTNINALLLTETAVLEGDEKECAYTEDGDGAGVTVGDVTTPAGTKKYIVQANPKTGRLFWEIKPGYFAGKRVYSVAEGVGSETDYSITGSMIDSKRAPAYIEVNKISDTARGVIFYQGQGVTSVLRSSNSQEPGFITYGNSEQLSTSLPQGLSSFTFDPAYNEFFIARDMGLADGQQLFVYVNGTAVEQADMGYQFASSDNMIVKVFAAAAAPRKNTITFTATAGATATVIYDKLGQYTDFSAPLQSYGPTVITITPAAGVSLTVDDQPVTLTGESYTFTATADTKVGLSKISELQLNAVKPADGATVKTLADVTLTFDMMSLGEHSIGYAADKVSEITLTKGETVYRAQGIEGGEPNQDGYPLTVTFAAITEAGDYTLNVPAGIFYETVYDETVGQWGDFVKVEGGLANKALTYTYTVDPAFVPANEKAVLTPADGTTVRQLKSIRIVYPAATQVMPGWGSIYLTKGSEEYYGYATPNYEQGTMNVYDITFTDENDEDVVLTAAGDYELEISENVFVVDGEPNGYLTAGYTVDPTASVLAWSATPANGSTGNEAGQGYVNVTFDFFNATEVTNVQAGEYSAIRVLYNGESVRRITDDSDAEAIGYQIAGANGTSYSLDFSPEVFSNPGKLEIEIEQGFFTVDDLASPAIVYSALFGDVKTYTCVFNPAPLTEQTDLHTISFTFPEAETVAVNEDNLWFNLKGGSSVMCPEQYISFSCEGNTVTMTVDAEFKMRPDTWSLNLGEGSFTLDGNQRSPEARAMWTLIHAGEVNFAYTQSPDGTCINGGYGMMVAIVYDEMETVTILDRSKIVVKFDGTVLAQGDPYSAGATDPIVYTLAQDGMMPNGFMINVGGGALCDAKTTGELTVSVTEGALELSGKPVPAYECKWQLVQPREYNITVENVSAEPKKSLDSFVITFGGADKVALFNQYGVRLRSKDFSYIQTASAITPVEGAAVPAMQVKFDTPATTLGEYILSIDYDTFILDGADSNKGLDFTFVVDGTSGIASIIASENGLYTVVNLSGVVLLKDVEADALNSLRPGFYIINGVKIAVK